MQNDYGISKYSHKEIWVKNNNAFKICHDNIIAKLLTTQDTFIRGNSRCLRHLFSSYTCGTNPPYFIVVD